MGTAFVLERRAFAARQVVKFVRAGVTLPLNRKRPLTHSQGAAQGTRRRTFKAIQRAYAVVSSGFGTSRNGSSETAASPSTIGPIVLVRTSRSADAFATDRECEKNSEEGASFKQMLL
jgi:hypothetical protein